MNINLYIKYILRYLIYVLCGTGALYDSGGSSIAWRWLQTAPVPIIE